MNKTDEFKSECEQRIKSYSKNGPLLDAAKKFMIESTPAKYSYNFSWMGRPIIQYPQDILAMQEIIWKINPDLIIETGIAHGGSLIFYASMLELLGGEGRVLGIDIDIREHNRREIEKHILFKRITMVQGSSIDTDVVKKVSDFAKDKKCVLIVLDSNHTQDHVLKELEYYSPLVTEGSYLVVFDTIIEDLPGKFYPDRPWDKGNNPKTAVREFLRHDDRFVPDKDIEQKLLITVAPGGYLKRVK